MPVGVCLSNNTHNIRMGCKGGAWECVSVRMMTDLWGMLSKKWSVGHTVNRSSFQTSDQCTTHTHTTASTAHNKWQNKHSKVASANE